MEQLGAINNFPENEDTWGLISGYSDVNRSEPSQKHRGDTGQSWGIWKVGSRDPCCKACQTAHALPSVLELGDATSKEHLAENCVMQHYVPGSSQSISVPFQVRMSKPRLDSTSVCTMGRGEPTATARGRMTVSGLPWKAEGDSWLKTGLFGVFLEKPLNGGHCKQHALCLA